MSTPAAAGDPFRLALIDQVSDRVTRAETRLDEHDLYHRQMLEQAARDRKVSIRMVVSTVVSAIAALASVAAVIIAAVGHG